MKKLLKLLNGFIWIINLFMYMSHLETYRNVETYEQYDFSNDIPYFK